MLKNIFVVAMVFFFGMNNLVAYAVPYEMELGKDKRILRYSKPIEVDCAPKWSDTVDEAFGKIEMCLSRMNENEYYRFSVMAFQPEEWEYIEERIAESDTLMFEAVLQNEAGEFIPLNLVEEQLDNMEVVEMENNIMFQGKDGSSYIPYILIKRK